MKEERRRGKTREKGNGEDTMESKGVRKGNVKKNYESARNQDKENAQRKKEVGKNRNIVKSKK